MNSGILPEATALNLFRESSDRFLYAKYRGKGGESYYLKEGQFNHKAAQWFTLNLQCPVEGCDKPEITTQARQGNRREAFRHVQTPHHSTGEAATVQALMMVERWMKEKYPTVETKINQDSAEILLIRESGDRQVVIIEYNSISLAVWQTKQKRYMDDNVNPIWLFGHSSQNFPDWIIQMKQVKLPYLQNELLGVGCRLLWVNPIEEKIASIFSKINLHACLVESCNGKGEGCVQNFIVEYDGKENNSFLLIDDFYSSTLTENSIITSSIQLALNEANEIEEMAKVEALRKTGNQVKVKEDKKFVEEKSEEKRAREEKIKEIIKNSPNVRELEEEKLKKKLERLARGEVKPSRTGYSCSVCGHALDVSLKEEGRHLLC